MTIKDLREREEKSRNLFGKEKKKMNILILFDSHLSKIIQFGKKFKKERNHRFIFDWARIKIIFVSENKDQETRK